MKLVDLDPMCFFYDLSEESSISFVVLVKVSGCLFSTKKKKPVNNKHNVHSTYSIWVMNPASINTELVLMLTLRQFNYC